MSKFCKICKDSRKPNSVVRSHNVRERGRVVCPTLMETVCRFCKNRGHTPKFCPKLKERERRLGAPLRNRNFHTGRHGQRRTIPVDSVSSTRKSEMALKFNDDDDEDGVGDIRFVIEFPRVLWGDGPGEDEPLQVDLLGRIKKMSS